MIAAQGNPIGAFLGPRERGLWTRCVTRKRQIEFLGGRVAGKLAASMYRVAAGASLQPCRAIDIYPQENGCPVCQYDDGFHHPISISHSNRWALALVSSAGRTV